MVSLARWPMDIWAIPCSQPSITSFFPAILTSYNQCDHLCLYINRENTTETLSMPCLLLHSLTQCEHEWSPSVPGAVHLLAALQSQHVVTRHLNIVIGIYCCTLNASEIRFCTYSMTLYLLPLLREGGSISCLYGFNLDSHTWLMMISTLSARIKNVLTI